jgi:hypothetical protein
MIEIKGNDGESIVFDGTFVMKFRHGGKEESARNPAGTYRQCDVKAKKVKKGREPELQVLLACATIFALTIPETEKPKLDELVAELERIAAAG